MNHPIAEIFSQGEEVITGQVTDTNAAWLSNQLVEMGFVINRHTAVGDKLEELTGLLTEISTRADFCICSGGLGPTIDDLTAEAVAQAFDCPLQLDENALLQIQQYFDNRGRIMAESNRKQAYFPQGAQRIDNAWGTAPGFAIQHKRCWFAFVPGVPTEMRHMFDEQIKQQLTKQFELQSDKLVTIKTIGIGESDLQQSLNDFPLPNNVQLNFRATADEVQTKLLFPATTADVDIQYCTTQLVDRLGDVVFAVDEPGQQAVDLVSVINKMMIKKNYTLSVFETLSQGLLSAKCIGQDWLHHASFQQSIGDYASTTKDKKSHTLEVSSESIARKLKKSQQSDLVLVQLYQGEKEQLFNKEKSIVLYNTLLTPSGVYHKTITVTGPIKRKQNQAAIRALDLLRRYLQYSAFNSIK